MWILAGLLFSIFDYLGYNLWGKNYQNQDINPYRVLQFTILILVTIALSYFWDWQNGIYFFSLWMAWCYDWMYYLIDIFLIPFGFSFEKGVGLKSVYNNHCNWAWWTFFGIPFRWFRGKKSEPINFWILVIQSLLTILTIIILKEIL